MNVTEFLASHHDRSGEQENQTNTFIAWAICYVVQRYFLAVAPSFVLTLSCRNSHTCNFYNDLLGQLFPMWGAAVLQVVAVTPNSSVRIPGRRYFNLLFVDSFAAFADIDVISYTDEYNTNEHYYIFLQARDYLVQGETQRILEYCWQHHLIHCNVQVQNERGEVLIYTYFPFTKEHCGSVVPVLVNRFLGPALERHELFPLKLRNFHGCPLVGAIWNVPPYLYLAKRASGERYITSGFEGNLVLELAKKLNFTLVIRTPPNDEQRGRFVNNTVNGALGMLIRREADFSIGSFRRTAKRDGVATSLPNFYQSFQIVALYMPAYNLSSLEVLTYPFQTGTWTLLMLITVMLFTSLYVVNRFRATSAGHNSHCYMDVLLMMLGMPARGRPTRHYSRLFCVNWLFFTLIIRTAYQAVIFHLIRTHVSCRLPTTLDDLAANNFTVVMNTGTYETLDGIALLVQMDRLNLSEFGEEVAFEYIERVPGKRMVAVGPLDFLLSYVHRTKKPGLFKTLKQSIVTHQTTMYMAKHSYLIDHFDEQILWMRAMGFMEIWALWELQREYLDSKHLRSDELLQLKQLHMMFAFIALGMVIGLIVFLLELLSKQLRLLRRLFEAI